MDRIISQFGYVMRKQRINIFSSNQMMNYWMSQIINSCIVCMLFISSGISSIVKTSSITQSAKGIATAGKRPYRFYLTLKCNFVA